jgi:histidinol-phosphate aminotransferase
MGHATNEGGRAVHGALDYGELERLGLHPWEVLDFSVNANPYGPSPRVREVVANAAIDRYPDRECLELRRVILNYELASRDLPLGSIVCGNGTTELIWAIARAYLKPGLKAAILGPTFSEYGVACLATGATVVEFRTQASACFQPDTEAIVAWIRREQPSLVWVCNPNNPTGTWLDRHHIQLILEACQRIGAMLVVDEAYWRFVFPHEAYSAVELVDATGRQQIIVLRSLTKDYALAGLRLGYAVASLDAARHLSTQLPSWNVNGVAQEAAIAALADRTHLKITLDKLAIERHAFFHALRGIGLNVIPSRTHFCLLEVGDAFCVRQQLLTRRILVRDGTSFGLPRFVRVATRPMSDWQQLVNLLSSLQRR